VRPSVSDAPAEQPRTNAARVGAVGDALRPTVASNETRKVEIGLDDGDVEREIDEGDGCVAG
jgi:hypothetical protein